MTCLNQGQAMVRHVFDIASRVLHLDNAPRGCPSCLLRCFPAGDETLPYEMLANFPP